MTGELVLEIGTEEIPARFIAPALEAMKETISRELQNEQISFETILAMGTPRRLVLCARGVAQRQADTVVEAMGPPEKVAFDAAGTPTKAAESFAQRQGVTVADLIVVETKKGRYLRVEKKIAGREAQLVLPEVLTRVISAIPFPKSMRWSSFDLRFARPVKWLLALFNGNILPLRLENLESSNQSWGHRFLSNKAFVVHDLASYLRAAEEHFVIADPQQRRSLIWERARTLAAEAGGMVLEDDELLDEVAYLVEYPVTLRGSFSSSFLEVPRDVLITSMREHQRYFAVVDDRGALLPYFIVVSNNRARDPNVVIKGNERVLAARLTDARFFFDEDRKRTLAERVGALKEVVFQEKLGSLYDKVSRVRALTEHLADEIDPALKAKADRAAFLCKADLLTAMVGEFPTLQGTMGREYALREGEAPEVAQAISEHYLPTSGKGELPASNIGAIVSIADKMDSIAGCFGIGLIPTGAADPYALRRQALGIIRIVLEKAFRLDLPALVSRSVDLLSPKISRNPQDVQAEMIEFIKGRFHFRLTAADFAADVVEAVASTAFVDMVDVYRRIQAVQEVKTQPDFEPLAAGFKRVANIIAANPGDAVDPTYFVEDAERGLYQAYLDLKTRICSLVEAGDYASALNALVSMKPAVDRFFDQVLVMCDDVAVRQNRLGLLGQVASLFHGIADFSRIVTGR